jgi:hypothetical protein
VRCNKTEENIREGISVTKRSAISPLSVVTAEAADPGPQPPGPLGQPERALWQSIQGEYNVVDSGGIEMLYQLCSARDRLAQLADEIAADGPVVRNRSGPRSHPSLKEDIALRAFICRTLARLGLDVEPVRPTSGRPGTITSWTGPGRR